MFTGWPGRRTAYRHRHPQFNLSNLAFILSSFSGFDKISLHEVFLFTALAPQDGYGHG
jgi:hypothetical protein